MRTPSKRIYYAIKEVASMLGEPESTLRYWESEFQDFISPKRNKRGVRAYTQKDMDDIRMIQYFTRDCGLTMEGVRKRLKNNKEAAFRQAELAKRLKRIRDELLSFREAMNEADKRRVPPGVYVK
jgi:DNA-binding transcriptional MerR regulator